MARIALVDASAGAATAVRAAAGAHAVVACRAGEVPADAALVIVDVRGSATAAAGVDSGVCPLLLLVDRRAAVDLASFAARRIAVVQKPCDLDDLRRKIRELLESAPVPHTTGSEWLAAPIVSQAAAATLAAARRLAGPVWIVGEPGTGLDNVAAALALSWDPEREPAVWQESDAFASVASALGDPQRVLWIPALDERPPREQRAFERFLALDPVRRVVVTSGDDPAEAVAAGALLRTLQQTLSRVALRLPPLRERPADIPALATTVGCRVAAALGVERFVVAADARSVLETYGWPGNLAELDAVVTRSVIALAPSASGVVELTAADLMFAPRLHPGADDDVAALPRAGNDATSVPGPNDTAPTHGLGAATVSAASPRRAVVVPLGAGSRAIKASGIASPEPLQTRESAGIPAAVQVPSGVEAVLAAFAHDIRNPMVTIKTFAGLQAAAGDGGELARLANEACERVDQYLDFLQRYAELTPAEPVLVDAIELLGEALDEVGAEGAERASRDCVEIIHVLARSALWTSVDPVLARFIAYTVVAECLVRTEASADASAVATADLSADRRAVEIRIATGNAAIDRLGKWVDGDNLPWRLALARDAARRAGGDLDIETEDGELRLCWRLPDAEPGSQASRAEPEPAPIKAAPARKAREQ